MDILLGKVTQQAMNYAIRSGITMTATYAISQSSKLLHNAPKSDIKEELLRLAQRVQYKIQIVSPAIDMIELIAARGNTSLESAVALTKQLRLDIQHWGQRMAKVATASEEFRLGSTRNKAKLEAENQVEMQRIIGITKTLLTRIDDAVPLINLALQTSGARLSTQFPSTVSPSRLLQASTLLVAGDTQYARSPQSAAQIGPTFVLSVYMLFAGHDRPETEEDVRNTTWKEVIHKARVKLRRVPLDVVVSTGSGSDAIPSHKIRASHEIEETGDSKPHIRAEARADEYAYQMMVIEDFDDDRHHDFNDNEAKPGPFDDVRLAGTREMIPIHEISKIFYADTSKVLNIGSDAEANHPVLLLRRDVQAVPPRRMYEREEIDNSNNERETPTKDGKPQTEEERAYVEQDHANREHDPWRLPSSLDPEWIAFEVYTESEDSEADSVQDEEDAGDLDFQTPGEEPNSSQLSLSLSGLHIDSPGVNNTSTFSALSTPNLQQSLQSGLPSIKTSLSLLELLLRLTSLQQFQQQSHLSITDELLNFFLEESASTGAGGDEGHRQVIRADARRKVGWDPYDESPLKRRGEDYQYGQQYASPRDASDSPYNHATPSPGPHDTYEISSSSHRLRHIRTPKSTNSPTIGNSSPNFASPRPTPHSTPLTDVIKGRPYLSSNIHSRQPRRGILKMKDPNGHTREIHPPSDFDLYGDTLSPNAIPSDEGIGTSPGSAIEQQEKET